MSSNHRISTDDDKRATKTARPVHNAQRVAKPALQAPHGWVSESIGLDSQFPVGLAKGKAGPDALRYEKVSVVEARMVRSDTGVTTSRDSPLRPRTSREALQDGTMQWLSQLPESLRPLELALQFPRIANKLCGLWTNVPLRDRYLTDLLMDTRDGTREGFPTAVAAELAALFTNGDTAVKSLPWGQIKPR